MKASAPVGPGAGGGLHGSDGPGAARGRPPGLRRQAEGRLLAGVCRGLAEHLGLDPLVVRLVFVVLTVANGVGIPVYLAFWVLVPAAPSDRRVQDRRLPRDWAELIAFAALTLGGVMLLQLVGLLPGGVAWLTIILGGLGTAILWQQADPAQRERWLEVTGRHTQSSLIRSLLGAVLVAGGLVGFLLSQGELRAAREGLGFTAIVVGGIAVITGPWVVRMARELTAERRERIRSQERAEFAARIHDSVLHTLTLIQRHSNNPREVQRLARAQERELRTWLYRPKADADRTLAAATERVAAEVEEAHGVPIEVVLVGDCPLDSRLGAALQAAREAMVNAAKYSDAPQISVYAEVEREAVTIFVRDRGKGFDLDAVPDDRLGVRQSIVGRMERNGGTATVRSTPGEGTEIELQVGRSE
ncbi:MAG: PspC domain-containing protein [Streptosporangiales bacterium]|nr:PspC domain-containing protein [Streptosporangiales bacterium]